MSTRTPLSSARSPRPGLAGAAAIFLDRDGVVNEGVPDPDSGMAESPLHRRDVRLTPEVGAPLRMLSNAGFALVCVSNQPAAAKGKVTLGELIDIHERVLELLGEEGVRLDAWRLCPHHPDGVVAELAGPCACRKPGPGMLLDAAKQLALELDASWMMGDTDSDVAAGRAASCRTALIEYPPTAHKRAHAATPDVLASNLHDAAAQLLARTSL